MKIRRTGFYECWGGVTSLNRSSLLLDVPTIAEQGLSGFEAVLRYGLVVPANTPRPIIDRLNKELRAALATDDVRSRFATKGSRCPRLTWTSLRALAGRRP